MSNTPTTAAPASDAWAEVRARDRVTRYRRSGAGRAVLLLDRDHGTTLWPELLHVLGANFRLIAPKVPIGTANLEAWIAEFLEALGTMAVAVVATCDYCVPAVDLVLRDSEQVERVVLVPEGDAEDRGREGALATSAGPSAVPLLIVRRGVAASEAVPTIARFLSGAAITR